MPLRCEKCLGCHTRFFDCSEIERTFNEFWKIYPRKDSKLAAKRAWRAIKPRELDAIIMGVRRYMGSGRWDDRPGFPPKQFIPLPSTFLNGRRWEDEIGKGAHEVETPQPRYCAICGHTGSWHLNETKHGRAPDHQFSESMAVAS